MLKPFFAAWISWSFCGLLFIPFRSHGLCSQVPGPLVLFFSGPHHRRTRICARSTKRDSWSPTSTAAIPAITAAIFSVAGWAPAASGDYIFPFRANHPGTRATLAIAAAAKPTTSAVTGKQTFSCRTSHRLITAKAPEAAANTANSSIPAFSGSAAASFYLFTVPFVTCWANSVSGDTWIHYPPATSEGAVLPVIRHPVPTSSSHSSRSILRP